MTDRDTKRSFKYLEEIHERLGSLSSDVKSLRRDMNTGFENVHRRQDVANSKTAKNVEKIEKNRHKLDNVVEYQQDTKERRESSSNRKAKYVDWLVKTIFGAIVALFIWVLVASGVLNIPT